MESIILMDQAFQQLAELATFQSVTMTHSFWGVGALTLTAHPQAPGAERLAPGVLLFLASDPQKVMMIEDIPTRTRDKITATGVQVKGLARRRIVVPPLSLPARLWRYAGGAWASVTDVPTIRQAMQDATVYQGFTRPAGTEGMLWLDMTELGTVYNWGSTMQAGEVVYDMGTAQVRSQYQNFGWDRYTGCAEDAYLHYATNNLIAPEDPKRAIPGLEAAPSQHRGRILPWQARFDKLAELYADIGEATGLGWDIVPDYAAKRWRFVVLEGRNLGAPTYAGENAPGGSVAVVSEEMGNAQSITRKQRTSGMSTTVYVGGSGEDENRLILNVGGEAEGMERREQWAEAGGVEDVAMLRLYGEGKLASAAATDTLDADVMDHGACRYGVDYALGDIVGVAGAGAQMNARVTEAALTYEGGRRSIKLTFGSAQLTTEGVLARWTRTAAR